MSRFGHFHEIADLPERAFCENKYEFTLEGGKGGSQSSTVEIPDYLKEPLKRNIARAEEIQKLGYMPYYGPDVAAFTPMQQAAFGATGQAAEAFGFAPRGTMSGASAMQGMPSPQAYAGGIRGYSSGDLYDQAVAELAARRPAIAERYAGLFADPMTGLTAAEVQAAANEGTSEFASGYDWMPIIDANTGATTDPLASYFDPDQGGYAVTQSNLEKAASRAGVDPNDYMIVGNQILRRTARG